MTTEPEPTIDVGPLVDKWRNDLAADEALLARLPWWRFMQRTYARDRIEIKERALGMVMAKVIR